MGPVRQAKDAAFDAACADLRAAAAACQGDLARGQDAADRAAEAHRAEKVGGGGGGGRAGWAMAPLSDPSLTLTNP